MCITENINIEKKINPRLDLNQDHDRPSISNGYVHGFAGPVIVLPVTPRGLLK